MIGELLTWQKDIAYYLKITLGGKKKAKLCLAIIFLEMRH